MIGIWATQMLCLINAPSDIYYIDLNYILFDPLNIVCNTKKRLIDEINDHVIRWTKQLCYVWRVSRYRDTVLHFFFAWSMTIRSVRLFCFPLTFKFSHSSLYVSATESKKTHNDSLIYMLRLLIKCFRWHSTRNIACCSSELLCSFFRNSIRNNNRFFWL